jgi:hypothetical protein
VLFPSLKRSVLADRTFTGREDLLEELAASLGAGTATAITQAIAGLGDGRTSLAVEYVYRHQAAPQVKAMQGGVVHQIVEDQTVPAAPPADIGR